MVSRRKFLAALSVPLAGLAGCQDREGTPEETSRTPRTEPQPSPPTDAPTPSDTDRPEETTETTRSPSTPTPDPFAERFETIQDVTEQGVDASGETVVDGQVQSLVDDDTLLRFPPGTYKLRDLAVEGVTNFGMIGDDATLQLQKRGRALFLGFRDVSDILFEGFSIDNTADNTAAWCDLRCTGGENVVRDYTVEGFVDVANRTNGFTVMVEGKDTSLTIENADLSQGAINAAATFVFRRDEFYDPTREAGSLTFRNCVMKGWGKEGLYASEHEGPLRVIGGEYANNAIVQVRVGGGNAPERAVVRNVSVTVDRVPEYTPDRNRIFRGIWLKEGDEALVENCDISLRNLGRDTTPGAIYVNDQFGRATIRDCTVTTEDVSRPALLIQEPIESFDERWMPSMDRLPEEWDITVENLTIDGKSPNTEAIRVEGRDGCTFHDLSIEKEGQAADGLYLRNVRECSLAGGEITTERFPVRIDFADQDDCVLQLSDASLTGTDVGGDVESITVDGDGTFCVGSDALSGNNRLGSEQLALTRTDEPTPTATPAGEDSSGSRLYGRWLEE